MAVTPDLVPHGTAGGYTNHRCRCSSCTAAHTVIHNRWKDRASAQPLPPHVHGTYNGYSNYRCRCDECRKARPEAERP